MILKPCPVCGSKDLELVVERGVDYEYGVQGAFDARRCRQCGLLHLNPRPDLDEIISFYPASYHAYKKPVKFALFRLLNGLRWRSRARQYGALIGLKGRILDVGCGDGEVLENLKERGGWDLWGIDFNGGAIEKALQKGLNVRKAVLETANLPARSFDLIIMNHLVEHLEDPVGTLRLAAALLSENGKIVGQLPNLDSWERRLFGPLWAGFHFPRHLQFFSPDTLRQALHEAGFVKVRVTGALHPGQWPISMENLMVSLWPGLGRVNGKTRFYGVFLLLCAPLVLLEYMFGKASIIDFVAEK